MRPPQKSRRLKRHDRQYHRHNPRTVGSVASNGSSSSSRRQQQQHQQRRQICEESTWSGGDSTTQGEEEEERTTLYREEEEEDETMHEYDYSSRVDRTHYNDEDDESLTLEETAATSLREDEEEGELESRTRTTWQRSRATTPTTKSDYRSPRSRNSHRQRQQQYQSTNHHYDETTTLPSLQESKPPSTRAASSSSNYSQSMDTHRVREHRDRQRERTPQPKLKSKSMPEPSSAKGTTVLYGTRSLGDDEDGVSSQSSGPPYQAKRNKSKDLSGPILAHLRKTSSSASDDDEPCILSVEPDSQQESSDENKQTTSYIINEPDGSVLDKLLLDQSYSQSHSRPDSIGRSKSHSSSRKMEDRLACSFSVEPLSPMSEWSTNQALSPNKEQQQQQLQSERPTTNRAIVVATKQPHQLQHKPISILANGQEVACDAMHAMLDHYLPSDVSDGPMNKVFDQYLLPSFPSSLDGSTLEQDSNIFSNSSTSHPLRFVNELALGDDDEDDDEEEDHGSFYPKRRQQQQQQRHHYRNGNLVSAAASPSSMQQHDGGYENDQDDEISLEEGIEVTERGTFAADEADIVMTDFYYDDGAGNFEGDDNDNDIQPTITSDNRTEHALKRGHDNQVDEHVDGQNENIIHNSLTNTSIQIVSPKYRGWKPEELEVVLLPSPKEDEDKQGRDEEVDNSDKSKSDYQFHSAIPLKRSSNLQFPTPASDTSLSSSHLRDLNDLQLELAGTIHDYDDDDDQKDRDTSNTPRSYVSSNFSAPGLHNATLSYGIDDDIIIPKPPDDAVLESPIGDDESSPHQQQPTHLSLSSNRAPRAKPLSLSINVHAPPSQTPTHGSSGTSATPTTSGARSGRKSAASSTSYPKQTKSQKYFASPKAQQREQQQLLQSCLRTPQNASTTANDKLLVIRGTRSAEVLPTYQTKSYLDTIVEQFDELPFQGEDDENVCPNAKDNENSVWQSTTDCWQSSLDSLRQLKARQVSQRQLLTSLIAERNGAKASASTAKSKLNQYSESHQDVLRQKDAELEGLRRQNHTLRVQVAHIQATKVPVDAPGAEVTRKLQFLNKHGAPIARQQPSSNGDCGQAPDGSVPSSRLYRSERTLSSEFVEIEQCMFELKTQEVTTLEVSAASRSLEPPEQRDDDNAPERNTDSEVQIAISKIIAKETDSLRQKVETLENQLELERSQKYEAMTNATNPSHLQSPPVADKSQIQSPPEVYKTIMEKTKSELEQRRQSTCQESAKMELRIATEEKDSAVAKWKSESNQRETLSKQLAKAQNDMKAVSSQNEKLTKQLADCLSSNQTYKERLTVAEKEAKTPKKEPSKVAEHKDKSLSYYKKKVQSLEEDLAKLQQKDGVLAEEYKAKAAAATRNEIRSLREHVESLQRDYSTAENGRVEALAKIEALEADLDRVTQELNSQKRNNAELEEKMATNETDANAGSSESPEAGLECDDYLQHYKRTVFKLEQDIAALKENEKVSSETARTEMSSLRQLVEKLRGDYEEAKRERDDTDTRYKDIEKELKRLRRDYEGTEKDRTRTVQRCKELEQELETTVSNLRNSSLDNEEVTMRADQLYAAKEECDEKITNLEAEISRLKVDAKKQISERDERIEELKDNLSTLERKMKEQEKQVTKKVKFDSEALETQLISLQAELQDVKNDRDNAGSDLQSASRDLARVRGDLEKANEEKNKLSMEVQQLLVTKEDYEGRVSNLMQGMSEAREEAERCLEEKVATTNHYTQQVASLEAQIEEMNSRRRESSEEAKREIASRDEMLSQFRLDLENAEQERDDLSSNFRKLARDLERTQRDLESRILDNTELSLRVEQLFTAKEECEENIATMESMLEERTIMETEAMPDDKEEELFMSKMRIATLEDEIRDLKELAETEEEITCSDNDFSADVYAVNREKQEALAKCSFLTKENETMSALLDRTRSELSQTIIEISRLEMDLDDARNGVVAPKSHNGDDAIDYNRKATKKIDYLAKQNAKLSISLQQSSTRNRSLVEKISQLESELEAKGNAASSSEDSAAYSQTENKALQDEIQRLEHLLTDARMQITDQQKSMETRNADSQSCSSEQRALADEIHRLQQLYDASERRVADQRKAFDCSKEEISELKDLLKRRNAQERTYSATAGPENAYLRRRVNEMEQELKTSEESRKSAMAQQQEGKQERDALAEKLRLTELQADHFRIQISEMEEKLCASEESLRNLQNEEKERETLKSDLVRLEDELEEKQKDVERLSAALDRIRAQEKESEDTMAYKNDVLKTHKAEYSKMLQKKDETMKKMSADLATARTNEAKLRKSLKESHERDRRELLVLREQVSNLQNDIVAAEGARKKITDENHALSLKLANASRNVEEKETLIKELEKGNAKTSAPPLVESTDKDNKEKGELSARLAETMRALDEKEELIKELEKSNAETGAPPPVESTDKEMSARLAKTMRALDEKEERIDALSDCLEKAANDKEIHMEEIDRLKKEIAALRSNTQSDVPRQTAPSKALEEVFIIPDVEKTDSGSRRLHSPVTQFSVGMSCSSDMSAVSKTAKDVIEKHTIYAQKLNDQLALAQKREEEVSRTTARKISLLTKEISKLTGVPFTSSFDERSQLSGNVHSAFSADTTESMEYDLECRLADVVQLPSMLELVVADKKKTEQKLQTLYKANAEYLDEIKDTISEQDDIVQRQGDVIETLKEELATLREQEKSATRTLVSEISLLEENISHLQGQYDSAIKQVEIAEDRLEIAMRERHSLEVALKQVNSERQFMMSRMKKVKENLKTFEVKMEDRIAKMKNDEYCPEHTDQYLVDGAGKLKTELEDLLSYSDNEKRKELRVQTVSSLGQSEYFLTLNDYDYQIFLENSTSNEEKQAIKAAASSQNKFVC